jgi:hypothetical protein
MGRVEFSTAYFLCYFLLAETFSLAFVGSFEKRSSSEGCPYTGSFKEEYGLLVKS